MDEKNQDSIGYAFKGKIMISSIAILFFACFVIVAFHVCRRRRSDRHLRRVTSPAAAPLPAASRGLDPLAVSSLPTFAYKSENQESPPECAVCLSEFEEGETGRILPECNHCFHVDCIDAWLRSHIHCPLCRNRVKAGSPPDCAVVSIHELEGAVQGSGSGLSQAGEGDGCPPSSSEDPDIPTRRDMNKSEGAPDPDRTLNQDPGFRVARFWL
ncbi:RING-H2 finger protein ATL2-like [Salvia miltiorrhiza]|uniref:RING-H2 finger protein ATL2-like n=1 Tax=Salvia miltiorrhiza TaxID=226208 RepID=UPI0025AD3745|nr:RING-H2 finger protein ATL2-like [Salvia miltiorrhiza]